MGTILLGIADDNFSLTHRLSPTREKDAYLVDFQILVQTHFLLMDEVEDSMNELEVSSFLVQVPEPCQNRLSPLSSIQRPPRWECMLP